MSSSWVCWVNKAKMINLYNIVWCFGKSEEKSVRELFFYMCGVSYNSSVKGQRSNKKQPSFHTRAEKMIWTQTFQKYKRSSWSVKLCTAKKKTETQTDKCAHAACSLSQYLFPSAKPCLLLACERWRIKNGLRHNNQMHSMPWVLQLNPESPGEFTVSRFRQDTDNYSHCLQKLIYSVIKFWNVIHSPCKYSLISYLQICTIRISYTQKTTLSMHKGSQDKQEFCSNLWNLSPCLTSLQYRTQSWVCFDIFRNIS